MAAFRDLTSINGNQVMTRFEETYDRLEQWTNALQIAVQGTKEELRSVLNPSSTLPDGCPSHASLGEFVFRGVGEKLSEVVGAVRDVEESIWSTEKPEGPTLRVSSVADYLAAVRELAGMERAWFRGQSNAHWALVPKVERGPFRTVLDRKAKAEERVEPCLPDALELEQAIFNDFLERGHYLLDPNARPSLVDAYFQAQHHGVPTRLLDWTQSSLVGLFFAVNSEPSADGAVYMLNLDDLWMDPAGSGNRIRIKPLSSRHGVLEHAVRTLVRSTGRDYAAWTDPSVSAEEDLNPLVCAYAAVPIVPRSIAGRAIQQSSTFTLHVPKELLFPEDIQYRQLAGREDSLGPLVRNGRIKKVVVPREAKARILAELRAAGTSLYALFPDLDHLASQLLWEHGITQST